MLYPETSLNFLISFETFLMTSLWFSIYTTISSANNDSFTSFFPIQILFISFSCLIAITRTSNMMLSRSGEMENSCLVPKF